jgi:anti-sigma factor ChrR (cupin superfamily)
MSSSDQHTQEILDNVYLYAVQALPFNEIPAVETHILSCDICRREVETLRPVVGSFIAWPTDVLRPSKSLWDRLSQRIADETGQVEVHIQAASQMPTLPDWEEVAAGISCKLLATDTQRNRVSMLVRLAPGTDYPPHRHSGVEELHLLDGELWINERKLYPGDYNRADVDSMDGRVWSETGCTCVLITSTDDVLL